MFVDPPLTKTQIAIVGFGEDDRPLVPWDDPAVEKWGLNMAHGWMPHVDRLFEMHARAEVELETAEMRRSVDHLGWMQKNTRVPVYVVDPKDWSDVPAAVKYPIEAFVEYFGEFCPKLQEQPYCESGIGWMMALAIMALCPAGQQRAEPGAAIRIYGVPLIRDEEYAYQRENASFFAGFAMGRGIRFELTPSATWLHCEAPYGYARPETTELLTHMREYYRKQQVMLEGRKDEARRRREQATIDEHSFGAAAVQAGWHVSHLTKLLRGGSVE